MPKFSLTELQLRIMAVLWERGEATIVGIQSALAPHRKLAQTTVATLLARMERKSVVTHRVEGRQYVYRAAVQESEVRRSILSEVTEVAERVFFGDVAALVNHLLTSNEIEAADLRRVREMIEKREAELAADNLNGKSRREESVAKSTRRRRVR